jgi:hypothetical protein
VVETQLSLAEVNQLHRRHPGRNHVPIASDTPSDIEQVPATVVRWEGLDLELVRHGQESIVMRSDPLPSDLDNLAVFELVVQSATTSAVTCFEDQNGRAVRLEVASGCEPGKPCPHDDDINI